MAMAKILRSTLEQGNPGDDFRAELLSVHAPPEDSLSLLPSLDRALIEAAEEMNFDWPEFLAVKRIRAGMPGSAVRFLLGGWLGAFSGWRGFLTTSATKTKTIY
jgi:hypothetical protein